MIGMSNSADLLTEYLDDAGETLSSLAARIGRSPSTLTRALRGERDASLKLARDVERGSIGDVAHDHRDPPVPRTHRPDQGAEVAAAARDQNGDAGPRHVSNLLPRARTQRRRPWWLR